MVQHPHWRPFAPRANVRRQSERVAHRQTPVGSLQERHGDWRSQYDELKLLILTAVPHQVLNISHVGSTAIRDLIAKPVIDIDLTVPDVEDELQYLPQLEDVGFRMIFRDQLGDDAHRQLTFADPNANLHVWNPGATEPQRHELFMTWLRANPQDRDRYAAAKVTAANSAGAGRYNDLKSAVVYDIYERIFAADTSFEHDPQPRSHQ